MQGGQFFKSDTKPAVLLPRSQGVQALQVIFVLDCHVEYRLGGLLKRSDPLA